MENTTTTTTSNIDSLINEEIHNMATRTSDIIKSSFIGLVEVDTAVNNNAIIFDVKYTMNSGITLHSKGSHYVNTSFKYYTPEENLLAIKKDKFTGKVVSSILSQVREDFYQSLKNQGMIKKQKNLKKGLDDIR